MRNVSVKEDNLIQMLEMQKRDRFEIEKELKKNKKNLMQFQMTKMTI